MNKLLLTFYGDDFTGSTDALEQLANFGIRALLFIEPPTPAQLKQFPDLQAVGVAGLTRSLTPAAMEKVLRPAFKKLKALGARHVHYKVCSTFDSSPAVGSIGRVIDVAGEFFHAPFVPLLVAAPALGRFTVFGNHFARFGIGSEGAMHRLDRHPAISHHPVTPMQEADLRLHLARQTKKRIALFDILQVALPEMEARAALQKMLRGKPAVVLFDAVDAEQMKRLGKLMDEYASAKRPLFSVGSSGMEMALGAHFASRSSGREEAPTRKAESGKRKAEMDLSLLAPAATKQLLVGSGSCSPVTEGQITWALQNGFAEVVLDAAALASGQKSDAVVQRATAAVINFLALGRSVIVHTTRRGADKRIAAKLKNNSAKILGTALGDVLRGALAQTKVRRLCIAGGDTSSFAARALGVEALEMIAPLTPGAPLCRAFARGSPADQMEIVFKGGQVGAENYFETVVKGKG
jgi:uncharacterized protein YgbK (DUF1537 family)